MNNICRDFCREKFGIVKNYSYLCIVKKNCSMRFSEIKKKLGKGLLVTVETSPYPNEGDSTPSILIREYIPSEDYSEENLNRICGFVEDKESKIISALKKAFNVEKIFAYENFYQDAETVNGFSDFGWKDVLEDKNGKLAECVAKYLICLPKEHNLTDIDEKIFCGIKFYTL